MSKDKTLTGKSKCGFEYNVPEENLNNYELMEVLGEIETNPLLLSKSVNLLLGKEQTERLKDHLRTESGMVPTDQISDVIMEIFESKKEAKNS